ncbi:MAG: EamA family transporter [Gammaproteobacteria bacterium]|nr:EamA family transporter [Gammaproteobacteria bacterium]
MSWQAYALISTFLYGLWGVFGKLAANHIGFKSLFVYDCLMFALGGLLVYWLNDFELETNPQGVIFSLLYGLTGMVATLFFILAISKGPVSVITAITAIYPVVTIAIALLFLNEVITLKQVAGAALAMLGVILMVI